MTCPYVDSDGNSGVVLVVVTAVLLLDQDLNQIGGKLLKVYCWFYHGRAAVSISVYSSKFGSPVGRSMTAVFEMYDYLRKRTTSQLRQPIADSAFNDSMSNELFCLYTRIKYASWYP